MKPLEHYRRPWLFYGLATLVPWGFWLPAAWISHQTAAPPKLVAIGSLFGLLGILAPMVVAFAQIGSDRWLRADCWHRLTNFADGRPGYWLLAFATMPATLLLAIAISLPLGYSAAQFQVVSTPSFRAGIVSAWAVLIVVPIIEELAWHTYGTDALRQRFPLFLTCMIFAAFWGVWHAPLALVKGYYHSNLVELGFWETLNFPVSIFPVVFLMNWLYYRAGRNIWIAALFHVTSGFFNELFAVQPRTKLIQTGILLVLAAIIVHRNRILFFSKDSNVA